MLTQTTAKRKAEGLDDEPQAKPTKKLQKASSRAALNSWPDSTSMAESQPLAASPVVEKSVASATSIDKSSAPATSIEKSSSSGAPPATDLQELEQPRKLVMSYSEIVMPDMDALYAMSKEELDAFIRANG